MRAFIWILAFLWLADAISMLLGLREPTNMGSGIAKGIVALFLADMARTIGDKKKTAQLKHDEAVVDLMRQEGPFK